MLPRNIDVYTIMKNEVFMVKYFLRHYSRFANKIFVFDDDSTDGTREILAQYPQVELCPLKKHGIDDIYFRSIYQTEYRTRSRGQAEWVMCVDIDEFIHHRRLVKKLAECKENKIQIIKCDGYSMISNNPPEKDGQIYDEIRDGISDVWMCKACVFDPAVDIHFRIGRHGFDIATPYKVSDATGIKLLHYRYLGEEYCIKRSARNVSLLSESNKKWKLGVHNFPESNYYHSKNWYDSVRMGSEVKRCV
jgi:glycosyltransferase involved in cell wall biosynthesis